MRHVKRELINRKAFIAIFLAATAVFIISNTLLGGYMFNKPLMGAQIMTEPDMLFEYNISDLAPFKYRILFAWVVQGTYELLGGYNNDLFFGVFIIWSYIFFLGACYSFFCLLRTLRFSQTLAWVGLSLFLISPAVIMGYTPPVHTREDFMAYTFLCLGLIFLLNKQTIPFMAIAVVSVMCRETLLILPFVMLFFTRYHSIPKRLVMAAIPFVVWVGFRILVGYEKYDMSEGIMYNIENYLQIPPFLFITFHAMWLLFLLAVVSGRVRRASSPRRSVILASAPWATALILITTFVGGIFNEIRLLNLAFPWIIITNLAYIESYKKLITYQINQGLYKAVVVFLGVIAIAIGFFILDKYGFMFNHTRYAVPSELWFMAGLFTFFLFSAWFPIALSIVVEERRKQLDPNEKKSERKHHSGSRVSRWLGREPAEKEYIH